jgi:hypothetical protein
VTADDVVFDQDDVRVVTTGSAGDIDGISDFVRDGLNEASLPQT